MYYVRLASYTSQDVLDQGRLSHSNFADNHNSSSARTGQQRFKSLDLSCAAGERPQQSWLGHTGPPKKPLLLNSDPQVRIQYLKFSRRPPRSMSLPAG